MDHHEARGIFARIVAGAQVPAEEEERALDHARTCDDCAREFGGERGGEGAVEPDALFDRALTVALRTHPEAIGRERAAEELGTRARVSPAALMALENAASLDPERRVRDAARRALTTLGVPPSAPPRPTPA